MTKRRENSQFISRNTLAYYEKTEHPHAHGWHRMVLEIKRSWDVLARIEEIADKMCDIDRELENIKEKISRKKRKR